ncbi:hypothetical protein ABZ023_34390 [Streptomyces sp. NPDC006367]|uniref:hypothetical protein n=1 Tax=unclassified Streptomyces TaxID=2593676 RepID=UPI0033B31A4A
MIRTAHYRLKQDPEQRGALLGVDLDVPVLRAPPAPRPRLGPAQAEQLLAALRALGL